MSSNRQDSHLLMQKIIFSFDKTLADHMERLFGNRFGIDGLPMTLATTSFLLILTEQITSEMENYSGPSERFTRKTLYEEMAEYGLTWEEYLDGAVSDMMERDYLAEDEDGRISAKKSTISMAQILDRIFPNLPGTNLMAYFFQIIDETMSGRKDPEAAVAQLNQILHMQGVPLKKQNTKTKGQGAVPSAIIRPSPEPARGTQRRVGSPSPTESGLKLSDMLRRLDPVAAPQASGTASASREADEMETEEYGETPHKDPQPPETEETVRTPSETISEQEDERDVDSPEGGPPPADRSAALSGPGDEALRESQETPPTPHQDPIDPEIHEDPAGSAADQMHPSLPGHTEGDPTTISDHDIERQIVEFEEKLSLQCPLCQQSGVKEQKTATGKIFYKCSNTNCSFISWGKPFFIECPRCRNPFLVEMTDRSGTSFLKCPRATCRYRKELAPHTDEQPSMAAAVGGDPPEPPVSKPKPKRRLVRRKKKLVRRKRS